MAKKYTAEQYRLIGCLVKDIQNFEQILHKTPKLESEVNRDIEIKKDEYLIRILNPK